LYFGGVNMNLLSYHKAKNSLSFKKEVQNLEFIDLIGNMEKKAFTEPAIREKYLLDIGKKLFTKKKLKKNVFLQIKLKRKTRLLSQNDIDNLLFTDDEYKKWSLIKKIKNKIRTLFIRVNIYNYYLLISIRGKEYKIFEKKAKAKINLNNTQRFIYKEVLSREELDLLLTDIDKKEHRKSPLEDI
jgi:hypothetical protein